MSKSSAIPSSPRTIRPRRPAPVLVCRKCLKRSDDGRAITRALKDELKARAKASGEKRAKVVMTSCFGICPKRAVVTATGATLARGEFLLVSDEGEARHVVSTLSASS